MTETTIKKHIQFGEPIKPETAQGGFGFVPNGIREKNIFFYHPDHLGSSSYITGQDGKVSQHTEYIAFGEILFDEHNTEHTMPYLFNGKELDQETNLTYFGARYLDMKTSLWLNTDPLSGYNPTFEHEHYIDGQHNSGVFNPMNLNTYGYTYQNPILYIDPNGKQVQFDVGGYIQQQLRSTWNSAWNSIFGYHPQRNDKGNVIIDHTNDAVEHYYRGNGESVDLGTNTIQEIKNSKDMQYYRDRIENGLTESPAKGEGLRVNMTIESWRSYHIGRTKMKYSTTCNSSKCTTTYTIYGDGFYDIFWGNDTTGSSGELGGDPYNYNPASWSKTFENPGYKIDKNGKPIPIPGKATKGDGPPNKSNYSSSSIPLQSDY
ncbi:MAG: RHS repeat domain-containing protein [Bergeyella cardium]